MRSQVAVGLNRVEILTQLALVKLTSTGFKRSQFNWLSGQTMHTVVAKRIAHVMHLLVAFNLNVTEQLTGTCLNFPLRFALTI